LERRERQVCEAEQMSDIIGQEKWDSVVNTLKGNSNERDSKPARCSFMPSTLGRNARA